MISLAILTKAWTTYWWVACSIARMIGSCLAYEVMEWIIGAIIVAGLEVEKRVVEVRHCNP
jgi:hypothetical protein